MKFFRCKKCGQIVGIVKGTGVPIICCGEKMEELVPICNDEGLIEKHLPTYKIHFNKVLVNIGSIPHPMTKEHYIEWVALETDKGNQRKCLMPGDEPFVTFSIGDKEKVIAIYAYCNLHSLWMLKNDDKCK